MKPAVLFIGKWSPFHIGHKAMIDKALQEGESVIIAIRDTPLDWDNPFTLEQRKKMIEAVYKGKSVKIITIPDVKEIRIGRDVGYKVVRTEQEGISASEIRTGLRQGYYIDHLVPSEIMPVLRKIKI